MVVADVGAGTGFIAAGLAPLVRRVYVVDGSAAMLDVARKNLSGFENIEYHQADGLELPFPDESLDAVFANMYLHHCPDPLAAIREMVRVLRPGRAAGDHRHGCAPLHLVKGRDGGCLAGLRARAGARLVPRGRAGQPGRRLHGQSCCAESANASLSDEQGREAKDLRSAKVSVFVATGTPRVAMRDAVKSAYSAHAENSSSCCSSSSTSSSAARHRAPAAVGVWNRVHAAGAGAVR